MKVGLDTSALYITKAGVARYIRGLLSGFEELGMGSPSIRECVWPVESFNFEQPARAIKTVYREFLWAKMVAPKLLGNVDVFHSPAGWFVDPGRAMPHVVTLHDLAVIRYPHRFRRWNRISARARLNEIGRADRIITVSRFTAEEAMQLLGLPAKKMTVIYLGCSFKETAREHKPASFQPPEEFFLFVGSIEPGKNLSLLVDAYDLAASRGNAMPPLIVVGVRWEGVSKGRAWPASWIYAGALSDEELIYLYRRATALLFPSIYEGFGLPILEAMNLGCPVICSEVASLPEVGGDAVLLADQEPTAYLHAMRRILEESPLRDEYRAMGFERARQFSWARCAEETAGVYEIALTRK